MAMPDMSKMVGPLPLGAWLAVVGGGLGIAVYTRRQSNAGPAYGEEHIVPEDIGTIPGVGTGPGWVAVPPPTTALPGAPEPTNNEEWARKATNWLIAQGYGPAVSDSAVRKYIAGEQLGAQEYTLTDIVLGAIGSPPVPLPPPLFAPPTFVPEPVPNDPVFTIPLPVTGEPIPVTPPTGGASPALQRHRFRPASARKPNRCAVCGLHRVNPIHIAAPVQSAPKPRPNPTPKARPTAPSRGARTVTVRPGDTLSAIARRYGVTWQAIANANKGRIDNPNKIYPGQTFVIPR